MTAWIDQASHHHWLEQESQRLLDFGRRFPVEGGAAWLDETGAPDQTRPVFTWITARMAHVYALGHLRGVPGSAPLAAHAIQALRSTLRDDVHGGWFSAAGPDHVDQDKSAYTHAFVVLASSSGVVAGLPGADELLEDALAVLDARFWDDAAGLHRDGWDRGWSVLDDYRGVNANMHTVEALMAAADATGVERWRDRALRIATTVVHDWAQGNGWRIPEHFTSTWEPLLEFNTERPDDPFKPYGATIGHGLEWARLVLHLHASLGAGAPGWMVPAATELYSRAVLDGWQVDGAPGFVYTTDWSGVPVVRERMHWVVAEAIGAAAALHHATGEPGYAQDYQRWWDYVAQYVIDRRRGSWQHELTVGNAASGSVWPGKPDLYHAYQATLVARSPLAPGLAVAQRAGAV